MNNDYRVTFAEEDISYLRFLGLEVTACVEILRRKLVESVREGACHGNPHSLITVGDDPSTAWGEADMFHASGAKVVHTRWRYVGVSHKVRVFRAIS